MDAENAISFWNFYVIHNKDVGIAKKMSTRLIRFFYVFY
jgi:hypothetical protein